MKKILFILLFVFVCCIDTLALPPTIRESGRWIALNSFQVVEAEIRGKLEKVCLPYLNFDNTVDKDKIMSIIAETVKKQDAVFNLYHDGLGRPKKQNGMMYASDVFLKELDKTYTGYINELGYSFKLSGKPAYEEENFSEIYSGSSYSSSSKVKKQKEEEEKKEKEKNEKKKKKTIGDINTVFEKTPKRFIQTIYDVLPPGVIHPSTRKRAAELKAKIEAMRDRPFKLDGESELDPVRWAKGTLGIIQESGIINGSVIEGVKPVLRIRVPNQIGWLTPERINFLKGKKCEVMVQRFKNGKEVFEDGAYLIRDLYLYEDKLSWEEIMKQWQLTLPEFSSDDKYATQPIVITSEFYSGVWLKSCSPGLCCIGFEKNKKGLSEKEYIRVFPPKNRPKDYRKFMKEFDAKYAGKPVGVTLLMFYDNKPYTEFKQKRALRVYFSDESKNLDVLQEEMIKNFDNKK